MPSSAGAKKGSMVETFEAIATRRMVAKVTEAAPSRADIEMLLDAAVRAPNHHLSEPWRFIVLTHDALDGLGEAMAERVKASDPDSPELEQKMQLERSRPHRAPVIIVAVYVPSDNPKVIEVEDRYAVGAAVENILLAAHSAGLGAYWRTGPAASAHQVHDFLSLEEDEEIAGFIYLGFPSPEQKTEPVRRTPAFERTSWMGWEV